MREFVEPTELLALVAEVEVRGSEPPEEAIMREPEMLIQAGDPGQPPLDLSTYEVRLQRSRDGEGPILHGMEAFVATLRTASEPTRVVSVRGSTTTYTYLLNSDLTRVIAGVAVDHPGERRDL